MGLFTMINTFFKSKLYFLKGASNIFPCTYFLPEAYISLLFMGEIF